MAKEASTALMNGRFHRLLKGALYVGIAGVYAFVKRHPAIEIVRDAKSNDRERSVKSGTQLKLRRPTRIG